MSAAIGGRSESIGAAPDRGAAQITSETKRDEQRFKKEFAKLSQEEKDLVISGGKFDKVPFGAKFANLFARKEFRQGLANKFISAPSGANVDRRTAVSRISTLDQTIAQAEAAKQANSQDRQALEKQGLNIYAGSPLDLAFSNKTRSLNNVIARAQSEKEGIRLQVDTPFRKKNFENIKVITDKRGGTGLNRGVFDPSGRLGLSKERAEFIKSQQLLVPDVEVAKSNKDKIQARVQREGQIRVKKANQDGRSGARIHRALGEQARKGNVDFVQRVDDREDAEFFTDQLLVNDFTRIKKVHNQEFEDFNREDVDRLDADFKRKDEAIKGGFIAQLGRAVPFSKRFSSNMKSGTNSKGISDKEREQFFRTKSAGRRAVQREREDLSTLAEAPIVKFQDSRGRIGGINGPRNVKGGAGNATQRQASLFEALQTLNRISGLPQFSGDRGHDTLGKARLGALNKVQQQRLGEQAKERSRFESKQNFDRRLAEIQNSGDIPQKEKRNLIRQAAKERDEGLKTKTVTNTQFEQSRAGFAASRTNIASGHTVKSVQDFIDLGRKKRRIRGN